MVKPIHIILGFIALLLVAGLLFKAIKLAIGVAIAAGIALVAFNFLGKKGA